MNFQSKPGEVTQAVKDAIDAGYRHIDCAHYYENEAEVGLAIKEKIASRAVKREDLFITSKLWSTFMRPDLVEPTIKESLTNLGLEYLDLYLIHWPVALRVRIILINENNLGEKIFNMIINLIIFRKVERICQNVMMTQFFVTSVMLTTWIHGKQWKKLLKKV